MDIHLKAVYLLTLKERCCKGDDRRVCCLQKFFHSHGLNGMARNLSREQITA